MEKFNDNNSQTDTKQIDIVLAFNDAYTPPALVTMNSIVKNRKMEYEINFHILHAGLNVESIDKILEFASPLKQNNVNVNFHNVNDYSNDKSTFLMNTLVPRITKDTFYRLFIPKILPHHTKVLYIDSDTLVLDDIYELFESFNIKDYSSAVVHDASISNDYEHNDTWRVPATLETILSEFDVSVNFGRVKVRDYVHKYLKLDNIRQYFNAGILLLNCKYINENGVTSRIQDALNSEFIYQDQCLLNFVLRDDVLYINEKWNYQMTLGRKLDKNAKILHFIGEHKPWGLTKDKVDNDAVEIYKQYAKDIMNFNEIDKEIALKKMREAAISYKANKILNNAKNIIENPHNIYSYYKKFRKLIKKYLKQERSKGSV